MLIVTDRIHSLLFTSILGLGVVLGTTAAGASAADLPPVADAAVTVTLVVDGLESPLATKAHTVGELLEERRLVTAAGDFLSAGKDVPLADGMRIVVRPAVPLVVIDGTHRRDVVSAELTVANVLAAEHVAVGPNDVVTPALDSVPTAGETVRIDRPAATPAVAAAPAAARIRTQAPVAARTPQARITAPRRVPSGATLVGLAERGFTSAVRMASSALRVVATAYTASCYGCSGMTASGARAGFGIIAVDPSIIPLGTRLFIPGYGHAVAGDTGGSIQGHRVDLGFNSQGEALRFGRRPLTIYILR